MGMSMDGSLLPASTVRATLPPAHSRLLQSLGQDFDIIIIDTPPASECADAHTVAVRAGAALVVARQNESSVPQMTRFTHSLREFGVALVGSVLNDA